MTLWHPVNGDDKTIILARLSFTNEQFTFHINQQWRPGCIINGNNITWSNNISNNILPLWIIIDNNNL